MEHSCSTSQPWIVLKFGGTSVSTRERWQVIQSRAKELCDENARVWVTCSALSQVTNKLQRAVMDAVKDENHLELFVAIVQQHLDLAGSCELLTSDQIGAVMADIREHGSVKESTYAGFTEFTSLFNLFKDLNRILEGIKLTEESSPRLRARVSSFGELMSTQLGVLIMKKLGSEAAFVDARRILCTTKSTAFSNQSNGSGNDKSTKPSTSGCTQVVVPEEDRYLEANITLPMTLPEFTKKPFLSATDAAPCNSRIVLTQGFIARNANGETCLLGRGGSDTSATLFAGLLQAKRVEIWTDVSGMFSADPRVVPDAKLIRNLCYREAQELAAMGAKVLHPRCISPAQWAKIPVEIRNTNDPHGDRTTISQPNTTNKDPQFIAVAKRNDMTLLTLTSFDMWGHAGFLSKVFIPFEQLGISVDLIATSQYSVSVTLDHVPGGVEGEPFNELLGRIQPLGEVSVKYPCSVVSIVGRKLRQALGKLGDVLTLLGDKEVYLLSESAEDLNLSVVVNQFDSQEIVEKMHNRLFA